MGVRFIKIAVFYFLIGVGFGMYMSMTQDFALRGVHAHVNLLGWASLALAGLIYCLFPKAEKHILGKLHFWGHNIGLPLMMIGLIFVVKGNSSLEPVIAIGGTLTTLSIILFFVNVLINVKAADVRQLMSNHKDQAM